MLLTRFEHWRPFGLTLIGRAANYDPGILEEVPLGEADRSAAGVNYFDVNARVL